MGWKDGWSLLERVAVPGPGFGSVCDCCCGGFVVDRLDVEFVGVDGENAHEILGD
jgi:hypothetical protein